MVFFESKNKGAKYQLGIGSSGQRGLIHVAMVTLDYEGTGFELTSGMDGDKMADLVRSCGGKLHRRKDRQCTRQGVEALISKVGQQCSAGDTFMFFFAGHGVQQKGRDGDENDGKDECLVLVDEAGKIHKNTFMTHQDLARCICKNIDKEVKIITFMDCCHSGTICHPNDPCWDSREVLFMSGCVDTEFSGGTGQSGIFTNCVLLALDAASRDEEDKDLSLAKLHARVLLIEDQYFSMFKQQIQMQSIGRNMEDWMWPLVPRGAYTAPLRCMFKQKPIEDSVGWHHV